MRILWISDSPDTPSGFGNVTRFVCEGLVKRGHSVSIIGWQSKQEQDWNGCKVFPASGVLGSRSSLSVPGALSAGDRDRAGRCVVAAVLFAAPHVRRQMELTDTPWALYFPIDGDMEGGGTAAELDPDCSTKGVDIPDRDERIRSGTRRAGPGSTAGTSLTGWTAASFIRRADRARAKAEGGRGGEIPGAFRQPQSADARCCRGCWMFSRSLRRGGRTRCCTCIPILRMSSPESGIYSYDVRADLQSPGALNRRCGLLQG